MVYDGAFIAEAFPALFLSLKQKKEEKQRQGGGKKTVEAFSDDGEESDDGEKGIIWLNFAEWRFRNTFSFGLFFLFMLLLAKNEKKRNLNIYN